MKQNTIRHIANAQPVLINIAFIIIKIRCSMKSVPGTPILLVIWTLSNYGQLGQRIVYSEEGTSFP